MSPERGSDGPQEGSMRVEHARIITALVLAGLLLVPVCAIKTAEGSFEGTITRGSRFTVTVIGLPNTAYYIWIPHTSTMTGGPHDQPPVITGSQSGIQQDSPEGPYPIGSYRFDNGGGMTIRDDIPPSTPEFPNTRYYGLVTTDSAGLATVEFLTSFNTAIRSYSVKVENPRSAGSDNLLVEIHAFSRTIPPIIATTVLNTATPLPETTVGNTPAMTTIPPATTQSSVPATTKSDQTPPRRTPLGPVAAVLATCAGLTMIRRT